MGFFIALLVVAVAGFVAGFLVCRKNYAWVKNVEQAAVDKAKSVVSAVSNKLNK